MKLLENEKNLLIMPIIYIVGLVAYYINMLSVLTPAFAVESAVEIITVFVLAAIYVANKKNENNMMKVLMGALLLERLFYAFGTLVHVLDEDSSTIGMVACVLYLLLYIIFFAVHVSVDIKDTNAASKLKLNTVIGLLIVVINIVLLAGTIVTQNNAISFIGSVVMEFAMVIELLCIERKITY